MKKSRSALSFIILVAVVLAGGTPVHAFNSMDEIFLREAVQEQMFILEAATVARLRSGDRAVREYADELIRVQGHLNKAIGKLSTENVPKGKRVVLPAALSEEQLKKMHELEEGKAVSFDRLFLKFMHHALESQLEVYEKELEYGASDGIRKFAADRIAILKGYLSTTGKMKEQTKAKES